MFLGCVNSEVRSIETAKSLQALGLLKTPRLLRIIWPADSPDHDMGEKMTSGNIASLHSLCGEMHILERDLLATVPNFSRDPRDFEGQSVILDITSMPKRFFYYYLKSLLLDPSVKDLMVTYCAGKYGNAALSTNHEDWDVLPTFRGGGGRSAEERARSRLVVNVGFMPGGLQEHLRDDDSEQDLFLLLPFPARVSSTRRVWKSAMEIHSDWHGDSSSIHVHRIGPDDLSGAFDLICRISNENPLSLAPFGPKPISAAMCIFASLTGSPVYYAQPKWYLPTYTLGPDTDQAGKPKISAYWIKHWGVNLYTL